MQGFKACLSGVGLAVMTLGAATLPASPALAQSPCVPTYIMQPGDTLYKIARQCRITLEALLEANPQIGNVRALRIGTEVTIPGTTPRRSEEPSSAAPTISVQPRAGAPGVEQRNPDRPPPDEPRDSEGVAVEGRISAGVECPILTTEDGRVYSLAGLQRDFGSYGYVRVRGPEAEISFCMQGEATINVESIEEIPPPR